MGHLASRCCCGVCLHDSAARLARAVTGDCGSIWCEQRESRWLPAAALAAEPAVRGVLQLVTQQPQSSCSVGWNKPPYWTDTGDGNYTGFVAAVLEWVCDKGSLECSEVPIDRLADAIPLVRNVSRDGAQYRALSREEQAAVHLR